MSLIFFPFPPALHLRLAFVALCLTRLAAGQLPSTPVSATDWPVYLGGKERQQYSPLAQINQQNVAQLEPAWTFETGDVGEYQSNNLIIHGVLYTASPNRSVIALDAATGRKIWQWSPESEGVLHPGNRQRGLVYWENETGGERRLFTSAGNFLYALDPANGRTIRGFGERGAIHLGRDIDANAPPNMTLNTPGIIYRDMLIFGVFSNSPGGIRAVDVRTGLLHWRFNLFPHPGEFGHETWPAGAYKNGLGANDWSGQSLDEARGILYVSSETAGPDFSGATRHGQNLFANSLVALDATTGLRLWHFQIVHHDLLDRDLPSPPVLLTVTHDGRRIDAVAQGTKHGYLFVFDRVTGIPLWPIEELPVPQSDLAGEQTWPTQPFPTLPEPLMRQRYTEADASTVSAEAHASTLERIKLSPNFGPFPAPSLKESIMLPGFDGGFEWGGSAADPDGILYANINEIPWILQMTATRGPDGQPLSNGHRQYLLQCAACHGVDLQGIPAGGFPSLIGLASRRPSEEIKRIVAQGAGRMPAFDQLGEGPRNAIIHFIVNFGSQQSEPREKSRAPVETSAEGSDYAFGGFRRWVDQAGYPAIKPPWGTLNAVDLNTGKIKWKVPLGEYPELSARGIAPTGTENYGGPIVTAGGLIFIGATADETIRAFDKETGKVLWQARLPFGGNATPSTYLVDGKQYVVISAGGGKSKRPAGGSIVAFRLPDSAIKH